jgi:hypothetical protein
VLGRRQELNDRDAGDARDRAFTRRLAISFAIAIALHEIFVGFLPGQPKPAPEREVAEELVTITKRPKPTPVPTPKPTPPSTSRPQATLAPQTEVRAPAAQAAATPHAKVGGAAAPKRIALVTPRPIPPQPALPVSLATGTNAGVQNGGTGVGGGPGNGTGGLGGVGSGTGKSGAGNGGDADTTCGFVDLEPGRVEYKPDGTVLQYVIAKVTTPNDVEVGLFPYPFIYSAERQNPFVHEDVKLAQDNGVPVQMPPPGFDPTTAPLAVQFVLKYTNPANGHTTLPECTGQQT